MCLKLKFVFAFGLFIAFNASVDSKEFCEAFAENAFKISYVFNLQQPRKYYLIIKGQYWSFDLDVKNKTNTDVAGKTQSKECPFFNDTFFAATFLDIEGHEWKNSLPLLFHKNDWKEVTVGHIPNKDFKTVRDHLREYQFFKKLNITGVNLNSQPKFVFTETNNLASWRPNRLTFVWKNNIDNSLRVERYDMKLTLYGTKITEQKYIKALTELKTKRKVLAIEAYWISTNGYIFVFEDQKVITWCWSDGDSLDKDWCVDNPTVLADCSKTTNRPTTSSTEPSTTEPSTSEPSTSEPTEDDGIWIWILIVIIVFFIILTNCVTIFVIAFICCGKAAIQKRFQLNAKSVTIPSAKTSNNSEVISKK